MYNKISKKLKKKLEFAYRSAHMHMSFQTTFPMPLEQIIKHILRARCLNTVHPHRDTRRSHVHNWQRRLYFCYFDARVRRPAGEHSLYYPFNGVYYPLCARVTTSSNLKRTSENRLLADRDLDGHWWRCGTDLLVPESDGVVKPGRHEIVASNLQWCRCCSL